MIYLIRRVNECETYLGIIYEQNITQKYACETTAKQHIDISKYFFKRIKYFFINLIERHVGTISIRYIY